MLRQACLVLFYIIRNKNQLWSSWRNTEVASEGYSGGLNGVVTKMIVLIFLTSTSDLHLYSSRTLSFQRHSDRILSLVQM